MELNKMKKIVLAFIFVFVLISLSFFVFAQPVSVFARWKFENNLLDALKGNYTLFGPAEFSSGVCSQGLVFDGNYSLQTNKSLPFGSSFSLGFWFGADHSAHNMTLLSTPCTADNCTYLYDSVYFEIRLVGDNLECIINGYPHENSEPVQVPLALFDGSWNHLIITYDGQAMKFYKNGQFVAEENLPAAGLDDWSKTITRFGASAEDSEFLAGSLDEFIIYDMVLNQEQVAMIYDTFADCVNCSNECQVGMTRCFNESLMETCGYYDLDSCTEWGNQTPCQYGCFEGSCRDNHIRYRCVPSPDVKTVEVGLEQGWNLVSLPLEPLETSLYSVLRPIRGQYLSLWSYTAQDEPSWKVHTPTALSTFNTLSPEQGFWINLVEDTSLNIEGYEINQTVFNVGSGWNLFSYPSIQSVSASVAFENISGLVSVFGYDAEKEQWLWYDPEFGDANTLIDIQPGMGLWFKFNHSAVVNFENKTYQE